MVTEYFLDKLNKLSKETSESIDDIIASYKTEYQSILARTQIKLGKPITNLLPKHKDEYFYLTKRIGEVAYGIVERKYRKMGD